MLAYFVKNNSLSFIIITQSINSVLLGYLLQGLGQMKFILVLILVLFSSNQFSAEISDVKHKGWKSTSTDDDGWTKRSYSGAEWETDVGTKSRIWFKVEGDFGRMQDRKNIEYKSQGCKTNVIYIILDGLSFKNSEQKVIDVGFKIDNFPKATIALPFKLIPDLGISAATYSKTAPNNLVGDNLILSIQELGISEIIPLDALREFRESCIRGDYR